MECLQGGAEKKINILEYDTDTKKYEERITHTYEKQIENILGIPNAKFLIIYNDGTGTLWDAQRRISISEKVKEYVSLVTGELIGHPLLFLDGETSAYAGKKNGKIHLTFYTYSGNIKECKTTETAGQWNIDSIIRLTDGSIMYATDTKPSGIHVATRDGKIVFTTETNDKVLLPTQKVYLLRELNSGSVAVQCERSIFVVKPQICNVKEDVDYRIELLTVKLRHNPTDLQLYSELAALYIEKGETSEKIYQLYLSGLQAAIKSAHIYQARRFYENARHKRPDSIEPCEIFLSHLELTSYRQLSRRIQLDLFKTIKPAGEFSDSLKKKRCKSRLFIGEGDFSFTKVLICEHESTHPNLCKAIIATDLTATHLEGCYTDQDIEKQNQLKERIEDLQQQGVTVLFGIDAEEIHRTFKGRRFKRIQWNCPFGGATLPAREEFKNTIPRFFQSCSNLQLPDDRVHVTLMQKSGDYWKIRQKENSIVLGSAEAGYRLIRKRSFQTYGKKRYLGYTHVKTGKTEAYSSGGEEQEFIFEKTNEVFPKATLEQARNLMDPHKKKYEIKSDNEGEKNLSLQECYFVCSTDEDSSDYYESDSDGKL